MSINSVHELDVVGTFGRPDGDAAVPAVLALALAEQCQWHGSTRSTEGFGIAFYNSRRALQIGAWTRSAFHHVTDEPGARDQHEQPMDRVRAQRRADRQNSARLAEIHDQGPRDDGAGRSSEGRQRPVR